MMLVITDAGLEAIGVDADETTSNRPTPTKMRAKNKKSQTAARQGAKQALLINLLKRKKGAIIEAIVETLDWLPHTVRAALTRLRQQGFQIERVRKDRVSRYRIADDRKAA